MKTLIFIFFCGISIVNFAGAQEQMSVKQRADRLYDRYEYFKSVNLYLKLVKPKTDIKILERIADCYRMINRYDDAEQWYARVATDAKASPEDHYWYAEVLLRNQKFGLAKQQYKRCFIAGAGKLAQKLAVCDSAALWMKQKPAYNITEAPNLNTGYSDWGLTYEGATGLVFTSDRLVDDNIDNRTGNNWFKLYETDPNGAYIKAFPLTYWHIDIFTNEYHIGPVAFNSKADTAYITMTADVAHKELPVDNQEKPGKQKLYTRRLELIIATKKDNKWQITDRFPYDDVQKYSVSNAALSPDGKVIYFESDMAGGFGKTDIWYCEKQAGGAWGNPVNCGKTVNTTEEDAFPTIGGDGALYYSSKGLGGMGGYDIYRTRGQKANWSVPENLKYPINSTSDDFYLVTKDSKSGYFSSNREGGKGSDDIYSFAPAPNEMVQAKPIAHLDTPKRKPAGPAITAGDLTVRTIYYDLDKSNIRPDAAWELDKLVLLLKQHPQLRIEMSSYTDSRASFKYNIALSRRRSAAAVDYLVKNGISASRLAARYYGETNLVNKCADNVKCTEEEHQLNRRTEFRLTGPAL